MNQALQCVLADVLVRVLMPLVMEVMLLNTFARGSSLPQHVGQRLHSPHPPPQPTAPYLATIVLVAILRMLMLVLMVVVVMLMLLLLLLLLLLQGLGSCHGTTVLPLHVQLGHNTVRRTAKQSVDGDLRQQQQVQCRGNHDSRMCKLPTALGSWLLPAAEAVGPCQCITDCAINSSTNPMMPGTQTASLLLWSAC